MKVETIILELQKKKAHFFDKYPLKSMAIFGSYARNEQTKSSDIDILVEFSQPIGFEFVDLAIELETFLKQKVDLVSKKGIKPEMLPYIEKDVLYV